MIYTFPRKEDPIRQGDIFRSLPRFDMDLQRLAVLDDGDRDPLPMSWDELHTTGEPITAVVAARPVSAIVISQDCDALSAPDITLCEIDRFRKVERKCSETKKAGSWMRIITQHARINQKWFYLPKNEGIGFGEKMAVNFMVTIRISREDLENLIHLRVARLNDYAEEHFRERIAQFFRRYPYDEWYALDRDEMQAYRKDHPDAEPKPWQTG